jgi:hypothetical protein
VLISAQIGLARLSIIKFLLPAMARSLENYDTRITTTFHNIYGISDLHTRVKYQIGNVIAPLALSGFPRQFCELFS